MRQPEEEKKEKKKGPFAVELKTKVLAHTRSCPVYRLGYNPPAKQRVVPPKEQRMHRHAPLPKKHTAAGGGEPPTKPSLTQDRPTETFTRTTTRTTSSTNSFLLRRSCKPTRSYTRSNVDTFTA